MLIHKPLLLPLCYTGEIDAKFEVLRFHEIGKKYPPVPKALKITIAKVKTKDITGGAPYLLQCFTFRIFILLYFEKTIYHY